LEIHEQAAAHPVREVRPAVAKVGKLLPPVNRHGSPEKGLNRAVGQRLGNGDHHHLERL
jgi:hypothetical protein